MTKYKTKFLTIVLVSTLCSMPTLSLADPKAIQQELLKRLMQSNSYEELTNVNPNKPLKSEKLILLDEDIAIPADNDDITKKDQSNYIGQRLLSLGEKDPKIKPLPNILAKEFNECKFAVDDTDHTFVDECVLKDVAPTYNAKADETFKIVARTPRCCLQSVAISSNNLTYEKTLDLFSRIPGVEKKPAFCKNLNEDGPYGERREFFTIVKDGKAKFTIQELTDGGSGGSNTSTIVYYGDPQINCNNIELFEKQSVERIKKINQQRFAQQLPPPPSHVSPPATVQKAPTQQLSSLSPIERRLAENYKTAYFCAGFEKDVWPDASRENCGGSGIVNNSKCEAFMVDWVFNDITNPTRPRSPSFAEYLNQNQEIYFGQYARGRSASRNRHSNNNEWFNAVSVCRNYINSIRKSFEKQSR